MSLHLAISGVPERSPEGKGSNDQAGDAHFLQNMLKGLDGNDYGGDSV